MPSSGISNITKSPTSKLKKNLVNLIYSLNKDDKKKIQIKSLSSKLGVMLDPLTLYKLIT